MQDLLLGQDNRPDRQLGDLIRAVIAQAILGQRVDHDQPLSATAVTKLWEALHELQSSNDHPEQPFLLYGHQLGEFFRRLQAFYHP